MHPSWVDVFKAAFMIFFFIVVGIALFSCDPEALSSIHP